MLWGSGKPEPLFFALCFWAANSDIRPFSVIVRQGNKNRFSPYHHEDYPDSRPGTRNELLLTLLFFS